MPDIPADAGLLRVEVTGGNGANVVVNVTGGGKTTVADSTAVAAKQRCTIVLAAAGQEEINVSTPGHAKIVIKRANGHPYFAVEQAIRLIASGKYPLKELCTHSYGMADVGLAIRTVAGDGVPGVQVSVLPWSEQWRSAASESSSAWSSPGPPGAPGSGAHSKPGLPVPAGPGR